MSLSVLIFRLALAATWIAAIFLGGKSERLVATYYVVTAVASRLACGVGYTCYTSFDMVSLLLDVGLLIALTLTMIRDPRWWLIASTALQLLTLLGYVAQLTAPKLAPMAFFMTLVASSWPSLILLWVGVAEHRLRRGTVAAPS
jgi:hypothetical protein